MNSFALDLCDGSPTRLHLIPKTMGVYHDATRVACRHRRCRRPRMCYVYHCVFRLPFDHVVGRRARRQQPLVPPVACTLDVGFVSAANDRYAAVEAASECDHVDGVMLDK